MMRVAWFLNSRQVASGFPQSRQDTKASALSSLGSLTEGQPQDAQANRGDMTNSNAALHLTLLHRTIVNELLRPSFRRPRHRTTLSD
jgi:hypothetical protein